jgi:hypothetical protein
MRMVRKISEFLLRAFAISFTILDGDSLKNRLLQKSQNGFNSLGFGEREQIFPILINYLKSGLRVRLFDQPTECLTTE